MSKRFADAIFEAEKISTKKEKAVALSGMTGEDLDLVREMFNDFRVFNIRKYDEPKSFAKEDPPTYQDFFNLLDALHDRELTGNAARDAVTTVLGKFTKTTAAALARVLDKNPKCGASVDTFIKIYPELSDIPQFSLMLAAKVEEIAEHTASSRKQNKVVLTEEIMAKKYGHTAPYLAESKYDGLRTCAFVTNGSIQYQSRSGKDLSHLDGIFDADLIAMERAVGEPIVVDGECIANTFSEAMKARGSKNDDAKKNLIFRAFDMLTRAEWDAQTCTRTQKERSATLEQLIAEVNAAKIVKSKYRFCKTIAELRDFYAEVLEEGQDENGEKNGLGEGLIIKKADALYEWDRSDSWLKWKPVIDLDLRIVGFEMGKGRLSNTIGKILLEGTDENGHPISARCGSGLNDKMRDYILKNQNILLDQTVCIEAQEISKAQNSETYSARFPVFIRFRDDK